MAFTVEVNYAIQCSPQKYLHSILFTCLLPSFSGNDVSRVLAWTVGIWENLILLFRSLWIVLSGKDEDVFSLFPFLFLQLPTSVLFLFLLLRRNSKQWLKRNLGKYKVLAECLHEKNYHPFCVCIYYINSEICVTTGLGIKKKKNSRLKGWVKRRKTVCLCVYMYYKIHRPLRVYYSSLAFNFSIRSEVMSCMPVPFIVPYSKVANTWPHTNPRLSAGW